MTCPRTTPSPNTWIKPALIACMGLLVFTLLLRLAWGYLADARLAAVVRELRARGEPASVADLEVPTIPDEQNAAVRIRKAAQLAQAPGVALDLWVLEVGRDELLARHDSALAGAASRAPALAENRAARELGQVDWGYRPTSPLIAAAAWGMSTELSIVRQMTKLACVAAIVAHERGDDAAALEHVQDARFLAEAAGQPHTLITFVTRAGCDSLALGMVERMTPRMRIGAAEAVAGATPAARERIVSLIAGLLDESSLREGWRRVIQFERVYVLDTAQTFSARLALGPGAGPANLSPWMLAPLLTLASTDAVQAFNGLPEGGFVDRYTDAPVLVAEDAPAPGSGLEGIAQSLLNMLAISKQGAFDLLFRHLAERRMAATALAIRMYELDHGQRPQTLDRLVPDYLAQVPDDPFAPEPRPIGYLRDDPQPRLHSAGLDSIDDRGAFRLTRLGVSGRELDLVWFLDGDRPRAAASSQAVEDDGAEQDAERSHDEQDAAGEES